VMISGFQYVGRSGRPVPIYFTYEVSAPEILGSKRCVEGLAARKARNRTFLEKGRLCGNHLSVGKI
jgi:hypothetical protein